MHYVHLALKTSYEATLKSENAKIVLRKWIFQ